MNTLIAICDYTGCSADYILFGDETNNKLNKKVIHMLNNLSPHSLQLSYDIIRSIKTHVNI